MVVAKERLVVLCTLVCLFAPWLQAADPYEGPNPMATSGDDDASTSSVLSHGMTQLHDLEAVGGVEDSGLDSGADDRPPLLRGARQRQPLVGRRRMRDLCAGRTG